MMRVELRHLQVIRSVAEAGSISRAATKLRIAQSGLTAQVQRIEQELGGQLFNRTPNGVALTDLGEHLVTKAADLCTAFDHLVESTKLLAVREDPHEPVRVCGPLGPVTPMLACAVREVLPDRPQVTHLTPTCEALNEELPSEEFDIAVCARRPALRFPLPESLRLRDLVHESVYIGLSASHRLADRPALRLAELADEDWVMAGERSSGLNVHLRLACERAGFMPRCRHRGADLATAAAIVHCGQAIAAFYPTAAVLPGIVLRPLVGDPLRRTLQLVWRRNSAIAEFTDLLHDKVAKGYQTLVRGRHGQDLLHGKAEVHRGAVVQVV